MRNVINPGILLITLAFLLAIGFSTTAAAKTIYVDDDGPADFNNIQAAINDSNLSGTLTEDTTLDANSSPWYVTGDVTVPVGVTLTIEPGVTVYFNNDMRLNIYGRLIAEGTPQNPIHFTRSPTNSNRWRGLQFFDTMEDNRISYAVIEYGRINSGMLGLSNSNLLLEHCTMDNTNLWRIKTTNSSLIVRNCIFADFVLPIIDNQSEHIWGSGVPQGGHVIIEKNVFGKTLGHNDAIDFDGPRPRPQLQIRNNIFTGGGDDALDLEIDTLLEGNVFMNYIKDKYNTAAGKSNIISSSGSASLEERDYTVVRNIFCGSEHVAQVKNNSFMTLVNNTIVGISDSVIYFQRPGTSSGRGAYVENSIFWETGPAFEEVTESTDLTVHHTLLPSKWHYLGQGNIEADPCFADPCNGDYHLKSQAGRWDPNSQSWVKDDVTSPCIDAGDPHSPIGLEPFPNGGIINMGAYGGTVEASKSYFGEPVCETIVAGDINGDCIVNLKDFALMALHWLEEHQ